MLIVFTTTSNEEEAENLARKIVESKFAACVQVLRQMKSFYVWEGDVQVDSEYLILIKTIEEKYDQLEKFIKTNHSYDTPEIVSVKSEHVSEKYFKWMNESLG